VPSVPHDVYACYDVLPLELAAMTAVNGFSVDVGPVIYPPWKPSFEAGYYEQADATVLVWVGPGIVRPEDSSSGVAECPVRICCVRRRPAEGSKDALRDVALQGNDVRRVMLGNPKRVDPSNPGAVNVWGYLTEEVRTEAFPHLNKQGIPVYICEGEYIVSVLWPYPKGY